MANGLHGALLGLLLAIATGCGGNTGNPGQTGDAGAGSLTGPDAFPVQTAWITMVDAQGACGYESILPDGSYATLGVLLTDASLSGVCGDASAQALQASRGHPLVLIQLKSADYPPSGKLAGSTVHPIGPGVYPVAFENLPDDDLCMAPNARALIDVRRFSSSGAGAVTVGSASSGTLTLTRVDPGHIAGSFDVKVATLMSDGQTFDVANPTPLTGTFDASACPGMP
jgi:hypothetical protein